MNTAINDGKIECSLHGSLTAVDCDSLQCDACSGCFIYTALKDTSRDHELFSLNFKESFEEFDKAIN